MNIKTELVSHGLHCDNSIVIGSGILQVLELRTSKDIDVVVTGEKYAELAQTDRFRKEVSRGRELLKDDVCEIGTVWYVLGKEWKFADFLVHSVVIDGVRYISLEFLLEVKRQWVQDDSVRQKDIDDVYLIEAYIERQKD